MQPIPLLLALLLQAADGGKPAAGPAVTHAHSAAPVQADGAAITPLAHVEERGNGPITLILVPGLSCDWRVYETFMERSKDRYRMFAVTLPGFGGSEPPKLPEGAGIASGVWLDNAEAAILKLIDERKLEKPVVVGHSMGGHLATRMAIHHGDRLRATVAIDGLPLFPPNPPGVRENPKARLQMAESMRAQTAGMPVDAWRASQKRSLAAMVKDPARAAKLAEMCAVVPPATTAQYMGEMMVSDLRPELARIRIPSLTISAVMSDYGPDAAAAMKESIRMQFSTASPSVRLVAFDDCRHFVMDDRPAELDAAIAEFLAGRDPVKTKGP